MRSIGSAFAWEAWASGRVVWLPTLGYLLGLIVLFQVAPAGTFQVPILFPGWLPLGFALSLPLGIPLLCLWGAFSHCGFGVGAEDRRSCYRRWAFTLPVRTTALAAWPFVLGASAMALLWLLVVGLVWKPCGVEAPLLWPTMFFAAFLTWNQALLWWPFPLRFLRFAMALPVMWGLPAAALAGYFYHLPEWALLLAFAGLSVTGHALAVAGLARARRGDEGTVGAASRGAPAAPGIRLGSPDLPPFASASQALFWMAWRRSGFTLPKIAGLVVLPLLVFLLFVPLAEAVVVGAVAALAGPLLLASRVGGFFTARDAVLCHDFRMSAFVAARPIPTTELIGVLSRVAVASALVTGALLVLPLLAVLPLTPAAGSLAQGLGKLVESQGVKAWVLLALMLVGTPVLIWKRMTAGFWTALTGRVGFAALGSGSVLMDMALPLLGMSAYLHPEAHAALLTAAPWVVGLALLLKLGAGVLVAWALVRRGLVTPRFVLAFAVVWVGAAAGLVGLTFWLLPPEVCSPLVVAGAAVLLLLPLVRLGLAPLALDWNRHR